MKKSSVILLFFVIVFLAGCSAKNNQSEALKTNESNYLTSNNVSMTVNGMGFDDEDRPYISVGIKNKSDQNTIAYGMEYEILKDGREVELIGTVAWEDLACIVKSGEEGTQTVRLENYDLKDGEIYRLVKTYHIEGYEGTYSAYIDFKIDRSKINGKILAKKTDVWTHNEMNSADEDVPIYLLGEDNVLYSKTPIDSSYIIKHWYKVCSLEEFKIIKDDFEGLSNGKWHLKGNSINKVIENNNIALRHIKDQNGNYYYFLKQNNNDIYYVRGWSGVDGLYHIAILG